VTQICYLVHLHRYIGIIRKQQAVSWLAVYVSHVCHRNSSITHV
jgi:hypothetical protein